MEKKEDEEEIVVVVVILIDWLINNFAINFNATIKLLTFIFLIYNYYIKKGKREPKKFFINFVLFLLWYILD